MQSKHAKVRVNEHHRDMKRTIKNIRQGTASYRFHSALPLICHPQCVYCGLRVKLTHELHFLWWLLRFLKNNLCTRLPLVILQPRDKLLVNRFNCIMLSLAALPIANDFILLEAQSTFDPHYLVHFVMQRILFYCYPIKCMCLITQFYGTS